MTLREWQFKDVLKISELEKECFPGEPWTYAQLVSSFQSETFFGVLAEDGDEIIAMIHYPPMGMKLQESLFSELFKQNGVKKVVFGHLHGEAYFPIFYSKDGIDYHLTSCDKVGFALQRIL